MSSSPSTANSPAGRNDTMAAAASAASAAASHRWLQVARDSASRAGGFSSAALQDWLDCAQAAYRALECKDSVVVEAAAALASEATSQVLSRALKLHHGEWVPGPVEVGGVRLQVDFRNVSAYLQPPLRLRRARDVPLRALKGVRYQRAGFGVALAALAARRQATPLGKLLPHSGMFCNLTAWIEPASDHDDPSPRLVLADTRKVDAVSIGDRELPLASDSSAAYAWAMDLSSLGRLGLWGLLGGTQIGRRAGVYLLEEYDPHKRPLVMIHGLGSSPLIWSHLVNSVWGDDSLRARYQIWQVVYQTDAPLLLARKRIFDYLDEAWSVIDPDATMKARSASVLVGHSLGAVIARLLCATSGDALWNAVFTVPPEALSAWAADLQMLRSIFHFQPYPGIARAIFLAAPHRGTPGADGRLGRLGGDVVGARATEVHALHRIAKANPEAIRPEMRNVLEEGFLNSITTLQSHLPVRRAAESLLPSSNIPYHTIAGVIAGRRQQTDGYVPLYSTMIPGAASCAVVDSGHRIHQSPRAIAEVLRILRE